MTTEPRLQWQSDGFGPLVVSDHPHAGEVILLEDRVIATTVTATGHADVRELAVFLRDADERLWAGVYGWSWGGCCEIQYLWVDPALSGRGLGRALIGLVEEEAVRRQCRQLVVFTHDERAATLYERSGYSLVGAIEDYPAGAMARWFRKTIEPVG